MSGKPAGRVAVLIVAAGRGARAGLDVPKQYASLAGEPVLSRTVRAFQNHPAVDVTLVVIHPGDRPAYDDALAGLPVLLPPVHGGATRQASVLSGLEALAAIAPDYVLVHDAARPLVSRALIDRVLAALSRDSGVIPALPIAETLKRVSGDHVQATVARHDLQAAQTPQGFPFAILRDAHRNAKAIATEELTDDAAVAARAGLPVVLVPGERRNMKLTLAEDFAMAEALLAEEYETRTAQGFDVHAFGPGDHVMLCGVPVPHKRGLVGHSDADVALHALTDALLGAIADGDIGQHFPPSDPRWKGAGSDLFLADAARRVRDRGGRVVNADLTIVCERPRIGPFRDAMRERVAAILGIGAGRVGVKATTSEGLGFTGRAEGIAAFAIATVRLRGDST